MSDSDYRLARCMKTQITPLLMFAGRAEEAIKFYLSLFDDSRLMHIERYQAGEAGPEGGVLRAEFWLGEQRLLCLDSPVQHAFGFTPASSLFVDCNSEQQQRELFGALSEGGSVLMPLGAYGFSRQFAWLSDRFGVSWQLNLADPRSPS